MPYHVVKRGDKFIVQKDDGSKTFGTHDTKAAADAQLDALYANEPKAAEGFRALHLVGATGAPRTEWLGDREYLVVPTVALIGDNVIHAVNAPEAEFVPASIISAEGWEHRPLMLGHPTRDGRQCSANDPAILAAQSFGFTAAPRVDGKRLCVESWCDVQKLQALGQHAMLADLRAGRQVEVSTGSFVQTRPASGVHNGRRYATEWASLGGDHLAFLPQSVGACSIAMGCGANRAAMRVMEGSDELRDLDNPEGINQYTKGGGGMDHNRYEGSGGAHSVETHSGVHHVIHEGKSVAKFQLRSDAHEAASKLAKGSERTRRLIGELNAGKILYGEYKKKMRGAEMNTGIVARLIRALRLKNLEAFDTPEQAASEEAAELIAYKTMRELLDQAGSAWDEMSALVDDLVADEEDNPTQGAAQEMAEEEVETARLEALSALCASTYSTLSALQAAVLRELQPDLPEPSDPRYMEALRAAVGARNSAADMRHIQSMHDSSVALGASCGDERAAAMKMMDCPECEGTGQVEKQGGGQMDCPSCDGEGQVRSAEGDGGSSAEGDDDMQKKDAIKALTACPCSGFTEADVKALEAFSEERLTAMAEASAARKRELDDVKASEAALKAAAAKQPTEEEFLAKAPESIRALVADKKAQDAAEKATLVTRLAAASTALTKEQLEAKQLDELRTLAAFAKVEPVDFSAMGVPRQRSAGEREDFTPPNAYEQGLKNLRAAESKAVN